MGRFPLAREYLLAGISPSTGSDYDDDYDCHHILEVHFLGLIEYTLLCLHIDRDWELVWFSNVSYANVDNEGHMTQFIPVYTFAKFSENCSDRVYDKIETKLTRISQNRGL